VTVNYPRAVADDQQSFLELVAILAAVSGEGSAWANAVTPDSQLERDLRMESVELAALGDALRARYGARVDLEAFFAGLEIEELIELKVADVLAYLASRQTSEGSTGRTCR
jgi:acyl carrier protein